MTRGPKADESARSSSRMRDDDTRVREDRLAATVADDATGTDAARDVLGGALPAELRSAPADRPEVEAPVGPVTRGVQDHLPGDSDIAVCGRDQRATEPSRAGGRLLLRGDGDPQSVVRRQRQSVGSTPEPGARTQDERAGAPEHRVRKADRRVWIRHSAGERRGPPISQQARRVRHTVTAVPGQRRERRVPGSHVEEVDNLVEGGEVHTDVLRAGGTKRRRLHRGGSHDGAEVRRALAVRRAAAHLAARLGEQPAHRRLETRVTGVLAPDGNDRVDLVPPEQRHQRLALADVVGEKAEDVVARECAVLPWLMTTTPRRRASSFTARMPELVGGPMMYRAFRRASVRTALTAPGCVPCVSTICSRTRTGELARLSAAFASAAASWSVTRLARPSAVQPALMSSAAPIVIVGPASREAGAAPPFADPTASSAASAPATMSGLIDVGRTSRTL